jgi:hypothetical protein
MLKKLSEKNPYRKSFAQFIWRLNFSSAHEIDTSITSIDKKSALIHVSTAVSPAQK